MRTRMRTNEWEGYNAEQQQQLQHQQHIRNECLVKVVFIPFSIIYRINSMHFFLFFVFWSAKLSLSAFKFYLWLSRLVSFSIDFHLILILRYRENFCRFSIDFNTFFGVSETWTLPLQVIKSIQFAFFLWLIKHLFIFN